MNSEKDQKSTPDSELNDRREALKKLGKYSAYVAPFTILALSERAKGETGHGSATGRAAPASHGR